MAESSSEEEEEQHLIRRITSRLLAPIHVVTSRPAIKAYLSTILFLAASLTLLAISTTAYLLFYHYYIPQIGLSRVMYLQYADGPFPYSTTYLTSSAASTSSSLASLQPYDVAIRLHLPLTPTNLAAGNFMLDLSLFSAHPDEKQFMPSVFTNINTTTPMARSRRPAILPYQSSLTSLTHTLLSLPFHALSLRDIDATTLSIPMLEQVTFSRGWQNLPTLARLEVQTQPHTQAILLGRSGEDASHVPIQIYGASIDFHARFQGLRWLMYQFRILSFLAFTTSFYCVALVSTGAAWGLVTYASPLISSRRMEGEQERRIKREAVEGKKKGPLTRTIKTEPTADEFGAGKTGDDSGGAGGLSISNLSESPTSFPTRRGQLPIRFPIASAITAVKHDGGKEEEEEEKDTKEEGGGNDAAIIEPIHTGSASTWTSTTAGHLADNEEEDVDREFELRGRGRGRSTPTGTGTGHAGGSGGDGDVDSGLGTSMEESVTARESLSSTPGLLLQRRRRRSTDADVAG